LNDSSLLEREIEVNEKEEEGQRGGGGGDDDLENEI